MRTTISALAITGLESGITASVGVAVIPDDAGVSVTLFHAADRAFYAARNNGRDRIEVASGSVVPSAPALA